MVLNLAKQEGTAPAAFVNVEVDSLAALGCIVNDILMLTDLAQNPFLKPPLIAREEVRFEV